MEESLPQQYSVLATNVQVFGFSTRAMNVLLSMGIKTVGELVGFSKRELRKQRTCGAFTVDDIEKKLNEVGIYLAEWYCYFFRDNESENKVGITPILFWIQLWKNVIFTIW